MFVFSDTFLYEIVLLLIMRREKKNKLFSKKNIVSIFIIFIMVSSAIGYMFGKDSGTSQKYNGYKFLQKGRSWALRIEGNELLFDFLPGDLENIAIDEGVKGILSEKVQIDTTSDGDDELKEAIAKAQYDMTEILGLASETYVRIGLSEENEIGLPMIDCESATASVPVVYFLKANETSVKIEGNCVVAKAKNDLEMLAIKDLMIYEILGII